MWSVNIKQGKFIYIAHFSDSKCFTSAKAHKEEFLLLLLFVLIISYTAERIDLQIFFSKVMQSKAAVNRF